MMFVYKYQSVLLLCFVILTIVNPIASLHNTPTQFNQLYVVPFSSLISNDSDGSRIRPYSSIQQALDQIKDEYYRDIDIVCQTTINLYPTYHFVDPLRFTHAHSYTHMTTMPTEDTEFYDKIAAGKQTHQRLTKASISGGIPVTGWVQSSGNIYRAVVSRIPFVNQLFVNNRRIPRTRVPNNYTDYLFYTASLKDASQARYGFQYAPGQFEYGNLADAMVVIYHSWTTSHHYIDRLIKANHTIFFKNPSHHAIDTYVVQGNRRFHIENLCEALVPNSFCFEDSTKTVYLMTDGSYDPTEVLIVAPVHEFIVVIAGEHINNTVHHVNITNIAIQHGAWNIGFTEQADFQAAAFLRSAALYIANATTIAISEIEISRTGSYGVWIREGTTNISITDSLITNTGAGGIRVGQMIAPVLTPTTFVNISSNEISYGGNVFPSGVGVISHRASDIVIADNHIHHHRYTGISVGWQWGYSPSETSNILVRGNYIHNIGRHVLCDQGGIYALGVQPGTVITNNVIKNVFSNAILMWGIYLDEGSSQIVVSNNIIYNTGWASIFQHYGANNTIINNVFARASLISPPEFNATEPDGNTHIARAENHTSWIFTRNIVYDIYKGMNRSAFKSDESNIIVSFSNNVYYNRYNTSLLFGKEQVSFDKWQKTGQDNNSIIADPLFAGDIDECDFFTVQADSPAAELGFINITKPIKWTPGCSTDGETERFHLYHW